jgi:hypothetical protein
MTQPLAGTGRIELMQGPVWAKGAAAILEEPADEADA